MKKSCEQKPNADPYQRQFRMTGNGNGIVLSVFFVVLVSAIIPAYGVLTCLAALLFIAGTVGFLYRPNVRIETELPRRMLAGERVILSYRITNISRRRTFQLSLKLPDLPDSFLCLEEPPTIPCVSPKETVQLDVGMVLQRRGLYELAHPVCRSTFPFHLFSFGIRQTGKTKLTVLPAFDRIRINEAASDLQAQHNVSVPMYAQGSSLEYASNRPFLSGDSLRNIDARAWARLAKPVVKEFHHEIYRHVAIVLSTAGYVPAARTASVTQDPLEAAVSLCASIAYSLHYNTAVDYLIIGTDLHDLNAFSRRNRIEYIHETLADVTPKTRTLSLDDDLFEHLMGVPECFVISLAPDAELGRALTAVQTGGARVNTVIVSSARPDPQSLPETWPDHSQWLSPRRILTKQVEQL